MKYHVDWRPGAEAELASLWTDSQDKKQVQQAADSMESLLATAPYSWSESRAGDERVMLVPPLAVRYSLDEASRSVMVLTVWLWGQR